MSKIELEGVGCVNVSLAPISDLSREYDKLSGGKSLNMIQELVLDCMANLGGYDIFDILNGTYDSDGNYWGENEIKDFENIGDYDSALSFLDLWCNYDRKHLLYDLEGTLEEFCKSYLFVKAIFDKQMKRLKKEGHWYD